MSNWSSSIKQDNILILKSLHIPKSFTWIKCSNRHQLAFRRQAKHKPPDYICSGKSISRSGNGSYNITGLHVATTAKWQLKMSLTRAEAPGFHQQLYGHWLWSMGPTISQYGQGSDSFISVLTQRAILYRLQAVLGANSTILAGCFHAIRVTFSK